MAINKKLIHFRRFEDFNSKKLSANENDTAYTVGVSETVLEGAVDVKYSSICWIKDVQKMWTHGTLYSCTDINLSDYLTEEEIAEAYATVESLEAKQDKVLKFTNLAASQWVSDTTYEGYPYRCDVTCSGVTANNYAEVVFALSQATSGSYAPLCETKANAVSIWSSENTSITIPTILVTI